MATAGLVVVLDDKNVFVRLEDMRGTLLNPQIKRIASLQQGNRKTRIRITSDSPIDTAKWIKGHSFPPSVQISDSTEDDGSFLVYMFHSKARAEDAVVRGFKASKASVLVLVVNTMELTSMYKRDAMEIIRKSNIPSDQLIFEGISVWGEPLFPDAAETVKAIVSRVSSV